MAPRHRLGLGNTRGSDFAVGKRVRVYPSGSDERLGVMSGDHQNRAEQDAGSRSPSHVRLTTRRAGADLRLLQKAMGHASITVTAHTYADLFDDELDNIAAAPDSLDDLSRAT